MLPSPSCGLFGGRGFHALKSALMIRNGQNSCIQANFSLSKHHKCFSYAFLHTTRCVDHHEPCESWFGESESTLKAQHNPSSWMDALPLVLFVIRTALKADTSTTAAEMVYDTTLRLPGEFFSHSSQTTSADPSDYVTQLKAHMQRLCPVPSRLTQTHTSVSGGLQTATDFHLT